MKNRQKWEDRFQKKKEFEQWYEENAYLMHAPEILLGDEMNSIHFDWEGAFYDGTLEDRFRIALADINASPYACCSAAVALFYQELHEYDPSWVTERILCPASAENDRMLRENDLQYLSLEGRMPPDAFDVICFSQQLIGDEVNLAGMLLDSGIPVLSSDRTEDHPLIIRGGASSYNPSVIMDVCDLFFMGEGEGVLAELLSMIQKGRASGKNRRQILLDAVRRWDCLWAPCFYEQRFDENGKLLGMTTLRDDVPEKIRYNYVKDLDDCFVMTRPIVNYRYRSSIVSGVEITRGCEGRCGFCAPGFTYMPFRVRSVDRVISCAGEYMINSGSREVTLNSFSGVSYPYLNELVLRIHDELHVPFTTMSVRLDSVNEDPDFCSLLRRQGQKRIVFGVEGISQRLRQMTSKNCSEEQILDTVRMLCRSGYSSIKFMFISGLPGESDKDREELVRLTEKLIEICREETPEGKELPFLYYSWTPLKLFPFTPFQWFEARPQTDPVPDDIRRRLTELGVFISDGESANRIFDEKLTQLFLRGDRRLQPLLIAMAEAGIRRHGSYDSVAAEFADEWISEHDVPGYSEWFAARNYDDVLPWDFIEPGADRDYLWKRFLSASGDDPHDFPRCLDRCQSCGACSSEHQREMARYRQAKKKDRSISLDSIDPHAEHADRPLRYMVLTFTREEKYRIVKRDYWMSELRRALDYAGIAYDRKAIDVLKPFRYRYDCISGMNIAVAGLAEDIPGDEVIRRLNENTLHMVFTDVRVMDHRPHDFVMSYRMSIPEGTDESVLAERIRCVMESTSWEAKMEIMRDDGPHTVSADVRDRVISIELREHQLFMKLDKTLQVYTVYQALLDIPWETAGRIPAVCTAIDYD